MSISSYERNGEIIHVDEQGREYVIDEAGNQRPPMQSKIVKKSNSGWDEYDSSDGHCPLCGRLTCRNTACIQGGG